MLRHIAYFRCVVFFFFLVWLGIIYVHVGVLGLNGWVALEMFESND